MGFGERLWYNPKVIPAGRRRTLLLINPGKKSFYRYAPPLGLAYIAAATPPDWEVAILDENLRPGDHCRRTADLVGITAMTVQANRAYLLSVQYRRRGIPVVLGGIHPSMLPEEALGFADAVVVGEAEEIWPKVIADFESGCLRGIYRADPPPDLGRLVRPRRDLLGRGHWMDILQTVRGCPFDCEFCSVSAFSGRRYRFRPVDDVLDEIRSLRKRIVLFVDDNIVGSGRAHVERAAALFEGMIRQNLRKRWVSQASVNVAENEDILRLMKASGCAGLLIGFESIRPETLIKMGKRQNMKYGNPARFYQDLIRKLHRFGIAVQGFICTDPSDDRASVLRTMAFIRNSGVDLINYPVVTPYPGTRLFAEKRAELFYRDFPRDWDAFDRGRLVYPSHPLSEREFYDLRWRMAKESNSLLRAMRRAGRCFRYSKSLLMALAILILNLYQIRLRRGDRRIIAEELRRLDRRRPAAINL